MQPDELVRAIRAALDETERIALAADGWSRWYLDLDEDGVVEHFEHSDPAAVLRRVTADRELVNMAENAFLSAGVFRDIDERWGAVEMQYLHVMRTLARGLGINSEEETG